MRPFLSLAAEFAITPYEKRSQWVQKNSLEGSNKETPPKAILLHIFSHAKDVLIVANSEIPTLERKY